MNSMHRAKSHSPKEYASTAGHEDRGNISRACRIKRRRTRAPGFINHGIGQAAVSAGLRSDVPLLLGIVIFSAIFVYCGNLIADIIYNFVDPRIKEGEDDG